MFRFKFPIEDLIEFGILKFQYIICFGSSLMLVMFDYYYKLFQYIICFGSSGVIRFSRFYSSFISIHHMFRFKTSKLSFKKRIILFQYIICFGSRPFKKGGINPLNLFQYIICFGSSCC